MKNLKVVPEKYIRESASVIGDEKNSFARLLSVADKYKEAQLTPMFLYDEQLKILYCVAEETYEKTLH